MNKYAISGALTAGLALLAVSCGRAPEVATSASASQSVATAPIPTEVGTDRSFDRVIALPRGERTVVLSVAEAVLVSDSWVADPADELGGPSYTAQSSYALGSLESIAIVTVHAHEGTPTKGQIPYLSGPGGDVKEAKVVVRGRPAVAIVFPEGVVLSWIEADHHQVDLHIPKTLKEAIAFADLLVVPSLDDCLAISCPAAQEFRQVPELPAEVGSEKRLF